MTEPVAYISFDDGVMRPVYEDRPGRQYVIDDGGERVYGVWFIPREVEADRPVIIGDEPF